MIDNDATTQTTGRHSSRLPNPMGDNPNVESIRLTFSLKVRQTSLGYVGIVKELPIVVESPTIDKLKEDLSKALLIGLADRPVAIKERSMVEVLV